MVNRKRITLFIGSILFIALLFGCSEPNHATEDRLEVGIDAITGIQAGKEFVISGHLINNSDAPAKITHGSDLFTYAIVDHEGNPIPIDDDMLEVNAIGYERILKPQEVYRHNGEDQRSKPFYTFVIDKPGRYKVTATAHYREAAASGTTNERVSLTSEPVEFVVE